MHDPATLVTNLGETRMRLRASLEALSDAALNEWRIDDRFSIAALVDHVSDVEQAIAATVLDALQVASPTVAERDLSGFIGAYDAHADPVQRGASGPRTRAALLAKLDAARFQYTQAVFNKARLAELAAKSMKHPVFGVASLKDVMGFIWMHERYHLHEIDALRLQQVDHARVEDSGGAARVASNPADAPRA